MQPAAAAVAARRENVRKRSIRNVEVYLDEMK
jgi:hypothetical protein